MNIQELDSYNLADAVKFHDRLNPRLWDSSEHLRPEVHARLMEIARDFQEFLGVPNIDVVDITISGSNAAYTYTPKSDIDLHLVVQVPNVTHDEVYRELFNAKKYQYNDEHNIVIGGADVELYAQDHAQAHHSQGIYSLLNNDWVSVPQRHRAQLDDMSIRNKFDDLAARIDETIKTHNYQRMSQLVAKIKSMRQTGLEQQGEFGVDNIAYKLLRNRGYIQRLYDAKNAARDAELSLTEQQPQQRVRYGFSESPDGVNPTTKMFLESDNESTVHEFITYVCDRLGIVQLPEIVLHTDPAWSEQTQSFGRYTPETHTLEVNLANRHIMDILRTVAHELVHCRQNQQHELPDSAGDTGSDWENQANALAGVIMRDYADDHAEKFAANSVTEATGYIPKNKREAQDPRFSMAITQDVHPGQVGKEANKMALHTGKNGEPTLLMKTVNLRESAEHLSDLDRTLQHCIQMIAQGQKKDAERYGQVAACLIDSQGRHTYAINLPGPDGTRRHAERVAISKHLKRYKSIGPGAVMVTTLSPCVHDMHERYGESCTDLLAQAGIERCYAGYQDPTQHPDVDYPFELAVTDNPDIFNACKQIAQSFLPKVIAQDNSGDQLAGLRENFADGRNPEHKGDSKRYHVPTKASVSTLRKVAKQGGRRGQLAHWMANMKAGRAKARRKHTEDLNELKINNQSGVGAVPYNAEIDYHGLQVAMKPSVFLSLALPLNINDPEERKSD
jgi:pyrimidine deaminase RibD-like protein